MRANNSLSLSLADHAHVCGNLLYILLLLLLPSIGARVQKTKMELATCCGNREGWMALVLLLSWFFFTRALDDDTWSEELKKNRNVKLHRVVENNKRKSEIWKLDDIITCSSLSYARHREDLFLKYFHFWWGLIYF